MTTYDSEIDLQATYRPRSIKAVSGGSTACTWDLALIGFERDARVRNVIANQQGPDAARYMDAWSNAEV